MSIPSFAPYGVLCPKSTISGGSTPRYNSQNKVFATLGRNEDQGTILGAKVPGETLFRKGLKLAKVREELPRVKLISPQGGGCEAGGAALVYPDVYLLPAGGREAAKMKGGNSNLPSAGRFQRNPLRRKCKMSQTWQPRERKGQQIKSSKEQRSGSLEREKPTYQCPLHKNFKK